MWHIYLVSIRTIIDHFRSPDLDDTSLLFNLFHNMLLQVICLYGGPLDDVFDPYSALSFVDKSVFLNVAYEPSYCLINTLRDIFISKEEFKIRTFSPD